MQGVEWPAASDTEQGMRMVTHCSVAYEKYHTTSSCDSMTLFRGHWTPTSCTSPLHASTWPCPGGRGKSEGEILAVEDPPGVFFFFNVSESPPSHAKASRRWFFLHISTTRRQRHLPTSLACKSEPEVVSFLHFDNVLPHHLPRMQKRAGGGFFHIFRRCVANATSPPPSHAKANRRCFFLAILSVTGIDVLKPYALVNSHV
jgi:hypothetical protein